MSATANGVKLTTKKVTSGTYRGVPVEIVHPHGEGAPGYYHLRAYGWCGYIYLWLEQVQDEKLREALWDDDAYRFGIWLDDLLFHGGVTFHSRRLDSKAQRFVKVGCDYRHYGDKDDMYDEHVVFADMCGVIDRLHARTTYLLRCSGDGRLATESEGIVPEGWKRWYSFTYIAEEIAAGRWRHHDANGAATAPQEEP